MKWTQRRRLLRSASRPCAEFRAGRVVAQTVEATARQGSCTAQTAATAVRQSYCIASAVRQSYCTDSMSISGTAVVLSHGGTAVVLYRLHEQQRYGSRTVQTTAAAVRQSYCTNCSNGGRGTAAVPYILQQRTHGSSTEQTAATAAASNINSRWPQSN